MKPKLPPQPGVRNQQLVSKASKAKLAGKSKFIIAFLTFLVTFCVITKNNYAQPTPNLLNLSLEELMNIDVTSISMRPEKLTEVASAVQVIIGDDIRHSGAIRLPEALKLASNLQIAQVNSHDWAITARGFNGLPSAGGILANKLLVMIDGRSIYNPLLGGVYWDVQNTLMEDIDRIEVVSGPGGTLWGANAVNGVINVLTKSADKTQGLYATGAAGSFLNGFAAVRLGSRSRIDSNLYFRLYAQHFDQTNTILENGKTARDAWKMTQGGYRIDYYPSQKNTFTLQGDFYGGNSNKDSLIRYAVTDGQNILARFTRIFSDKSDLRIQAYYDRTWRQTPRSAQPFFYRLYTYEVEVQHRFPLGKKHSILYGVGYRYQRDKTARSFVPLNRDMPLYSVFVQDEITIAPEQLKLTIGSKFLHNVFTGFEYQPSARIGWTLNKGNTIWASVSRAVRLPTRFDADVIINDPQFKSEKVHAFELGYRVKTLKKLLLSFATFYNDYDDIRSLDTTGIPTMPIIITNSQVAQSWGFEFNGNYQVLKNWHLRGGFTYFKREFRPTNKAVLPVSEEFESVDPASICLLQSKYEIRNFSLDIIGRFVDALPAATTTKRVSSYFTVDARLAYRRKAFEISVVGQNLFDKEHIEVGKSKIPRTISGRITFQL